MTGGTYGVAAIAGPLLGGVFTDKLVCSTHHFALVTQACS